MDDLKKLPTRTGPAQGQSFERKMIGAANGQNTIRTVIRNPSPGVTTRLRTRGGAADFVTEVEKHEDSQLIHTLYCRLLDVTHPWGLSYENGAVSPEFAWPNKPVSKGKFPSSQFNAKTVLDLSNPPGPNRWIESQRSPNTGLKVSYTWSGAVGGQLAVDRPFAMLYSAYTSLYGFGFNTTTVTIPGGSETVEAGQYFPGQVMRARSAPPVSTAKRFVYPNNNTLPLFIGGADTPIAGAILAAGVCQAPVKHVCYLHLQNPTAAVPACNAMTVSRATTSGASIPALPNLPVTLPAGIAGVLSIDKGPAINASGTQAVLGAEVLLTGYDTITNEAYRKFKVLLVDLSTGAASEYAVGGVQGTIFTRRNLPSITGTFPDVMFGELSGAANSTRTALYEDTTVVNELCAVGYKGDDLRVVRLEASGHTRTVLTRSNVAVPVDPENDGTINGWQETSVTQTRRDASHRETRLVVEPLGTLHTAAGGGESFQSATYTAASYSETVDVGWSGHPNGTPMDVLVDFSTDTYLMVFAKSYRAVTPGVFTSASLAGSTITRTTLARTVADKTDITLVLAKQADLATPSTVVDAPEALYLATEYDTSSTTASLPPMGFYSGAEGGTPYPDTGGTVTDNTGPGLSMSRRKFNPLGVDGVTFAVRQDGKAGIVSALLGNRYDYSTAGLDRLRTFNVTCRYNADTKWSAQPFALPDYVGSLGWICEPVIITTKAHR